MGWAQSFGRISARSTNTFRGDVANNDYMRRSDSMCDNNDGPSADLNPFVTNDLTQDRWRSETGKRTGGAHCKRSARATSARCLLEQELNTKAGRAGKAKNKAPTHTHTDDLALRAQVVLKQSHFGMTSMLMLPCKRAPWPWRRLWFARTWGEPSDETLCTTTPP